MTTDVLAVRQDVSIETVTDLLLERGMGGVPVVDSEGRPRGVVSKTDLLGERILTGDTEEAMGPGLHVSRGRYRVELGPGMHAEALPRLSAEDVMTYGPFTLSENAPVPQAAGIVTSADIVRWLATQSGYLAPRGRRSVRPDHRRRCGGRQVEACAIGTSSSR